MAQSIIGQLRVILGLDAVQFGRDAKKAEGAIEQLGARMQGIGAAMSAVSAGIALAIRGSLNAADQLQRQAALANTSIEQFQRAAAAAQTVGIEQEKLADILKDVSDRVGDFLTTGGGPMADFFETIAPKVGVTAEQFRNLSGADALQLYVSSLEAANLTQSEMIFFMEAMASDASALIPLLRNGGAEMARLGDAAQEAGIILSSDTAEAAKDFNVALTQIAAVGRGLTRQIAAELAPAMAAIAERIADAARAFASLSPQVRTGAAAVVALTAALGPLAFAVGTMLRAIEPAVKALVALRAVMLAFAGPIGIAVGLIATGAAAFLLLRDNSQKLPEPIDEARRALELLNESMGTFTSTAAPQAKAAALSAAVGYREQAFAALAAAEGELALLEAKQATARALFAENRLTAGGTGTEDDMARQAADLAALIDSLRNSLEMATSRVRSMATEFTGGGGLAAAMQEGASSTETLNLEMQGLDDILQTISAAGAGAGAAVQAAADGAEEATSAFQPLSGVMDTLSRSLGDLFSGGITSARQFFDTLVSGFQRALGDMVAAAARNRLAGLLGGGASVAGTAAAASTGGGGGLISGIAGALGPAALPIAAVGGVLLGLFGARRRRRQERARRAAQEQQERDQLDLQILELQGNEQEVRARQLAALRPDLRERQEEIFRLQDQNRVAEEREDIERRLLELQGDSVELRRRELDALDPANRALAERAFALENEARVAAERRSLEERLLQVLGATDELRRREVAALDQSNRGLLETIFRIEDLTSQFEELQRRLSARFDLSSRSFLTAFEARFAQAAAARELATPGATPASDPQLRALQDLMRKQIKVLEDIQFTGLPMRA